ncbi:heme biosynthesis protein HemY [Pacificibacter marinus]|uniref:Putative protoheme IX biogenesis protein n=1 Tax=Pacificibacter marinus TaxID=658057 RepID=A0A1Y5SYN3_9RHOB|nr:heme biosynthesis HemY N-terminal domain-containing protein [Pacificibacter marinus]SEL04554.1 HemY protein [Pacificibacter marinus]SLN51753.1 putative protoheme IX biogenesis protein [Pacificibacter marinus]
MLWSLVKIVFFVVLVAALAFGGMFLMDSEGSMDIAFMGFKISLSPIKVVIAIVVLLVAAWVLLKLVGLCIAFIKFLLGDETALSRYFHRNRERKGFEAMAEGMMALASGEGRVAMAKASKAEKYLGKPELTNLLTAQAAEMTGDKRKAQEVYRRLVADDRTRFVGVRGIMKQKLAEGDTETALKLAEKAFAIKPKHVETQDTLLQLQAGKKDWAAARNTLAAKLKHGAIPRDVHKRRDAVLALSEAKGIFEKGATLEAQEAAIEANKKSPDLIPAAVMAADEYTRQGKARPATKVLKKAWDAQPHPDLAAAFARIAPDETPAARIKRFTGLVSAKLDHPETKMLMTELQIAAEDFPAARRALGELIKSDPTARSMTLMAAIERGEGAEDVVVRGWLTRALTAPRGPQWICDKCQTVHAIWTPVCDNCAAFDTLSWRTPPHSEVSMPSGTEMLPMIVGASSDAAAQTEDAEVVANLTDQSEVSDADIIELESNEDPDK